MPVEFIGAIRTKPVSELNNVQTFLNENIIDKDYIRELTLAHEKGGFDRVLVAYRASNPDSFLVASYAASISERLGFLIAHRPGFVAPTLAARVAATLDHFTNGRIAVHIITGGYDTDQQRDGDWLDHGDRYRRTDEYLEIVRRIWTSDIPFDYEGEFYRLQDAFSAIKPLQKPHIPLYFGGASDPAVQIAAKHSNVYAMWGEPIAAIKERIAKVRAALPEGRSIGFSVSVRPILGATKEQAWEKAYNILAQIKKLRQAANSVSSTPSQAVGSHRLVDFAQKSEIYDKCLWTPIAAVTDGAGNTTALVGTPEEVAEALIDYYEAGVTTLLIRGFDLVEDAIAYGRDIIPQVQKEVARRERQAVTVGN
ncbi:MAG: LLM class flavin-dependent oxidoreductase [Nostoc sp. GBBB01]|uniref:LLM class flavin-dependent oxidoreductase n=1 Tax=Nostoc punctiforme FACHB-252 TaxID=1357509 RepID=A0ABR8H9X6_NOSPU|nr:LLM class flavin-dependent oxidoreductase [Nostoc punctiforme]MBD2612630.1 LLM class flavin-dependent oxidoreductase [Nostoc punctiforme FACHB-252]MBL1202947.1 LLM class flavin-dependent oxidoreductase [Nostoc sp. GBBB01]